MLTIERSGTTLFDALYDATVGKVTAMHTDPLKAVLLASQTWLKYHAIGEADPEIYVGGEPETEEDGLE